MLPELAVTTPFYNSEKYLPYYFRGLLNLNYPKSKLNLFFGDNESTDNTYDLLSRFCRKHRHEYNSIKLVKVRQLQIHLNREEFRRKDMQIVNIFGKLLKFAYPFDVVNIDSDVEASPDALQKLVSMRRLGADLCAGIALLEIPAIVENQNYLLPYVTAYNFVKDNFVKPLNNYRFRNGKYELVLPRKPTSVDAFGFPLFFIKREVLESVKYFVVYEHLTYSDVNFSYRATKRGFTAMVDPTLVVNHLHGPGKHEYMVVIQKNKVIIKTLIEKPCQKIVDNLNRGGPHIALLYKEDLDKNVK